MKLLPIAVLTSCLVGCVSTTHFSEEYSRTYVLRSDTVIDQCRIFTGSYSFYFGAENVRCFRISKSKEPGYQVMKSGSVVHVNRLYRIGAVDAFYDSAELSVMDNATGKAAIVYLENWPDREKILQSR